MKLVAKGDDPPVYVRIIPERPGYNRVVIVTQRGKVKRDKLYSQYEAQQCIDRAKQLSVELGVELKS